MGRVRSMTQNAQAKRRQYAVRKSIDLCTSCSNYAPPGKAVCVACRSVRRYSMATKIRSRRARGVCTRCGGGRDQAGRVCCTPCLARLAELKRKQRATEKGKLVCRIRAFRVRQDRERRGLCMGCGAERDGDYKTCGSCREKDRARRRRRKK